ncbi:MAG: LysM domain-containing protein [Pirellulales bacterium]
MSMVFNGSQADRIAAQQGFPLSGVLNPSFFPPTSRYHGLSVLQYETETGQSIAYLERRFLPDSNDFADLTEHSVALGDRLDNIAYQYLGDPEQYWRIADANVAMQPEDLTAEIGSKIRITLPRGIPGASRA